MEGISDLNKTMATTSRQPELEKLYQEYDRCMSQNRRAMQQYELLHDQLKSCLVRWERARERGQCAFHEVLRMRVRIIGGIANAFEVYMEEKRERIDSLANRINEINEARRLSNE